MTFLYYVSMYQAESCINFLSFPNGELQIKFYMYFGQGWPTIDNYAEIRFR